MNIETEKMNDAERDALRVDIAKAVFAAMYSRDAISPPAPDLDAVDNKMRRRFIHSRDAERATRAVDAANFLIAELELAQIVERVVFEDGSAEQVAPPSSMKCVHGIPAAEDCPLCTEQDRAERIVTELEAGQMPP